MGSTISSSCGKRLDPRKFFPIDIAILLRDGKDALDGADPIPPKLPTKEAVRAKPALANVESEFMNYAMARVKYEKITLKDAAEVEQTKVVLYGGKYNWRQGQYIDPVAEEEKMEKSG